MYMHVGDLSEYLESDNEPKSKVHKTSGNSGMLTADKDRLHTNSSKPNADDSGIVVPAKVKKDSIVMSQTTRSLTVLNENVGTLTQGSLGMYTI